MILGGICYWFRLHFWRPFGTLWPHFGVLLAQIGSLLVPCRARFWLFCTLGVSFWFVVGEINPLRQYVAKKYTCIDLASNFLQIFRMQIIFPRPGGGTIAAGNRDRYFSRPCLLCWSRLPAAIVPHPGLGKRICMRKICKKFDARSMQVYFFANFCLQKMNFAQNESKRTPEGSK